MRLSIRRASPSIRFLVVLLAAGSALAANDLATTPPRSPAAPPSSSHASLVREHAARAEAWARDRGSVGGSATLSSERGLVAWKRFDFPPTFVPDLPMKAAGPGRIAGVSHQGVLAVFDAAGGRVLGSLAFDEFPTGFDVGSGPAGPRALLEGTSPDGLTQGYAVVDLSDAAHPRVVRWDQPCVSFGIVLPGGRLGFAWGRYCSKVIAMDDGRSMEDLGGSIVSAYGTSLDGAPALLILRPAPAAGEPETLEAWSLRDPASPAFLWTLAVPSFPAVWTDAAAGLLAVAGDGDVDLFDLHTGAPLSSIAPAATPLDGAFVDAPGTRALALAYDGSVELFDLTDPRSPRSLGSVDAQIRSPYGPAAQSRHALSAREDRPWLGIATADPPGFVVVDASDASVVAAYEVDHTIESALIWTDLEDGRPAVVWSGTWNTWTERHPDGGLAVVDTVAIDPAAGPQRIARYAPVSPSRVDAVVPVEGRYAVVADFGGNAIVLVDASSGKVVDATGFSQPVFGDCWWQSPIVASAGSTLAIGDGCAAEILDVRDGRLVRRAGIAPSDLGYFSDLKIASDGSALSLWPSVGVLEASRPDGSVDSLSLGPYWLTTMALDRSRRRAVVASGDVWADPSTPLFLVGLDAPGLRVAWSQSIGAVFATFVRDDAAVAATVQSGYRYGPRLLDASTGVPLGPLGDTAIDFYYFGPGIRFGTGPSERLVYWNWTWLAWSSAVFDVSESTPRLMGESSEYLWDPQQLPRDDGRSAFEVRSDETRVVDPDGSFVPAGGDRGLGLRKLRRGFWTGHADDASSLHPEALLLRDPEVDRPPVAVAGPDRTYECASPEGTPARLDGRGSTDPDSTPGTEDDIVRYAWRLGGDPAGTGSTVEVDLPVGTTAARLEVTDALGLASASEVALRVADTIPPAVTLALAPEPGPGGVWAHIWSVRSSADDACDGTLAAPPRMPLASDVLSAPVSWARSASEAVEIVRGRTGASVRLSGPDEARVRAHWTAAVSAGGLVPASDGVALAVAAAAPRGATRGLSARYALDDAGAATAAAVYGDGADIPFVASASDAAGNVGFADTSFRRAVADLCAATPDNVVCRDLTGS